MTHYAREASVSCCSIDDCCGPYCDARNARGTWVLAYSIASFFACLLSGLVFTLLHNAEEKHDVGGESTNHVIALASFITAGASVLLMCLSRCCVSANPPSDNLRAIQRTGVDGTELILSSAGLCCSCCCLAPALAIGGGIAYGVFAKGVTFATDGFFVGAVTLFAIGVLMHVAAWLVYKGWCHQTIRGSSESDAIASDAAMHGGGYSTAPGAAMASGPQAKQRQLNVAENPGGPNGAASKSDTPSTRERVQKMMRP